MNEIMIIRSVRCRLTEDGTAELNLEDVSRGLGFTDTAKSGNEVVRWATVRSYLHEYNVATRCDVIGREGLPEFILENIFYKLCFKAKNETAVAFQNIVTDEILPAIRKTGHYEVPGAMPPITDNPMLLRAQAMLINAQNRRLKLLMGVIPKDKLSSVAAETLGLKALQEVTDVDMSRKLPETERTWSATEAGKMIDNGISSAMVGRLATAGSIKTDEHGQWVMDKSRHSTKEMPVFRYNVRGVERLRELYAQKKALGAEKCTDEEVALE